MPYNAQAKPQKAAVTAQSSTEAPAMQTAESIMLFEQNPPADSDLDELERRLSKREPQADAEVVEAVSGHGLEVVGVDQTQRDAELRELEA